MLKVPDHLKKVRKINLSKEYLINFETQIKEEYEKGLIRGPIHLSKSNEDILIDLFQYVDKDDWVFPHGETTITLFFTRGRS